MTVLLPPTSDERKAHIDRQIRRRWRLSLAAATVISALIGALASYFVGRSQRIDTRAEVERLERLLSEQTLIIRNLEAGAVKTASELRSVTDALNRLQVATARPSNQQGAVPPTMEGDMPAATTTATEAGSTEPPTPTAFATRDERGFSVSLVNCRRTGGLVNCELRVINRDRERYLQIYANGDRSRAVDLKGNEYYADRATVGSRTGENPYVDIPTDVVIRAEVRFSNIPPNAALLAVVQLSLSTSGGDFKIEFRRVPIAA